MAYDIQNTDGTLNYTVDNDQVNTSQFSLALIGRNTANYGQYFAQNAIRHLENFAGVSSPTPGTKLIGQLWFDKGENLLRVWDGTNWKRTGVVVGTARPTEGEGAGTQFFNLGTNKLEVHNGTAFVEASYPGEVTTAYSSIGALGSPAHYGTRLRTLFLTSSTGLSLPVLALVYTKSGTGSNVGTTTVNGQLETIMTLYSDHESFTIANPTATPVGAETIDYYPELTGSGGIASDRTGRSPGVILPGSNQRAEYEASQTSNFNTLYATAIGDASNPVSTGFVDTLTVNTQLNIPGAASVTGDLTVGGSIGLTGDIVGTTSTATFADLVVTANTTLRGNTTIDGNLTLNGVNTQTLGTDSAAGRVETIFGDTIDTQTLTVDGVATVATINATSMTVSSLSSLSSATISGVTTLNGAVNLGDAGADVITVNGTTTFNGATTFSEDIVLSSGTNLTISNGTLVLAGSSSITGAASNVLIDNQGSLSNARYLTFVNGSTDDTQYKLENDPGLTYIPSTNTLQTSIVTVSGLVTFGSLSDGATTITAFVDEDNMASNSATLIPTQQSVKAYVDAQVTASDDDLTVTGDSGTFVINLDAETLGIKTGAGLTSVASGSDVTTSLDTTLTGMASITSAAFVGPITGEITSSGTSGFADITVSGTMTGIATKATTINLANETSSASDHYVTFSAGATGYEAQKTDAVLKYIPSSSTLVADNFSGQATVSTAVTLVATNSTSATHYPLFVDTATGNRTPRTDTGYTYNPGSGTLTSTIFSGTATTARYADLAEIYSADADYEAGTVVKLGGSEEITQTTTSTDTDVFGVISTDPAYLMNSSAEGLPVAMTGRCPVKVIGNVNKGERLVSSDVPGVAWALGNDEYDTRAVIGRALQNKDNDGEGIIEAVIGVK